MRLRSVIILVVLVTAFYWKLSLTRQYDWMWSPDLAGQVLPWFEVQARAWHEHAFPLWDPYLWGGQPLLGQAQPGAAYPLNWLLFLLPLDANLHIHAWALNAYFLAIHFMAALFCYLLCRDLGCSELASIAGGCIFAFAGFVGSTDWPQMVNGAVWMPLVFLFLLRAVEGGRTFADAAASGACVGAAWLSGHHQVVMFTSLAALGVWIWAAFRGRRWNRRICGAIALWGMCAGLCGALQILPAYEYGKLAKRWVGAPDPVSWNEPVPYYVHEEYSLTPTSLLGVVFPATHTNVDPFVGVVALAFAVVAVMAGWGDWRVRVLTGVGVGALAYAIGSFSLLQGVLYALVPGLDKARTPAAASAVFGFAAAALAALGLDVWLRDPRGISARRATRGLAGFGLLLLAAGIVAASLGKALPESIVLTMWASLLLAAIAHALATGGLSERAAGALAATLMLFDLYQGSGFSFARRGDPDRDRFMLAISGKGDVAQRLRQSPGHLRAEVADGAFNANWGEYHDVPMWFGYLASVSDNVLRLENGSAAMKKLWGVAYQVATKPGDYARDEAFAGAGDWKLYRQPEAFPRAWAVHKLVQVATAADGNRMVADHLGEMRTSAFLADAPPQLPACNGQTEDAVTLTEEDANHVGIAVKLNCESMVVLSSTYFPGWHARVDGKPARVYEVNGAMRGIVAPAGVHTVTMRYRPASVYWGAALSLLGLMGVTGMRVIRSRPRRMSGDDARLPSANRGHDRRNALRSRRQSRPAGV